MPHDFFPTLERSGLNALAQIREHRSFPINILSTINDWRKILGGAYIYNHSSLPELRTDISFPDFRMEGKKVGRMK